ncbi:hypothetical protein PSHT_07465, partial [Puccinia striiformis]
FEVQTIEVVSEVVISEGIEYKSTTEVHKNNSHKEESILPYSFLPVGAPFWKRSIMLKLNTNRLCL